MSNLIIKHRFTSAVADGSDATQIQPSNWNDLHSLATPDGIPNLAEGVLTGTDDGAGSLQINGIVGNTALQYLRRNAGNTDYEFGQLPTLPAGGIVKTDVSSVASVVNGSPLQYLRKNAAGTDFEFTDFPSVPPALTQPFLVSSDYNFLHQLNTLNFTAPGSILNAGSNSITWTGVCPLGINGSDASHYIYISQGIGPAEACLITGGSCTSGVVGGTLIFTCANAHSGAFTLSSATGGVQEAKQVIVSGTKSGIIYINENIIFYQGVYAVDTAERIQFIGKGREAYNLIQRAQTFIAGDIFHNAVGSGACWYITHLGMQNGLPSGGIMSGCGVYCGPGQVQIEELTILNGQYGVRLVGANTSTIHNMAQLCLDMSFKSSAGISLEGLCTNIWISDCIAGGSPSTNANVMATGLRIMAADGVWISNCVFSADAGIAINPNSDYIANIFMQGGGVDTSRDFALLITGAGFPVVNLKFSNVHFASQSDGTSDGLGPTVYIDPSINLGTLSFVGGEITSGAVDGVAILATGTTEISFIGVSITDNNRSNGGGKNGITIINGATNIIINGCTFANTLSGHQKYGVVCLGTCSGAIVGNNFVHSETGAVNLGGTFTGPIKNNLGIDNITPAIALGATIAWPINPNFTITGTGVTVTAVNMTNVPVGASGIFRTTGGAITFTATGGIGNAITTVQNVPVTWVFDGTSVWLK